MEATTGFDPVNRGFADRRRSSLVVFLSVLQLHFVSGIGHHEGFFCCLVMPRVVPFVSKMLAKGLMVNASSSFVW